jgi:ubiquitin-like domain-containing CTD phosphatase 1
LVTLALKQPVQKVMLIGSVESDIAMVLEAKVDDTVVRGHAVAALHQLPVRTLRSAFAERWQVDDFADVPDGFCATADRPEVKAKLEARIAKWAPEQLNAPRAGAKLLCLDVDYTLFDHRSTVETPLELMRPHLHEFLTTAYTSGYDIIIWSATSIKWVYLKMKELGVLSNPNYKVVTLVDCTAMITVTTDDYGTFDTKPLPVIWAHYSQHYGPMNTIMFDDLRRNFVVNPQNGLRIRPCRNLPITRGDDHELDFLSRYLVAISKLDDLSALDHSQWESYLAATTGFIVRRKAT